jgi:hypothetical protein
VSVLPDVHLRAQSFPSNKGGRGLNRAAKNHEVKAMSKQVSLRFFVSAETLKLAADTIGLSLALLPRIEYPSRSASPNCIEFGAFARPRGRSSGGHYTGGSIGGITQDEAWSC